MKPVDQRIEINETSSDPSSPMLTRSISSKVLYAFSLPTPRRKNALWHLRNWVLICLILFSVLLFWMGYNASDSLRTTESAITQGNSRESSYMPSIPHSAPSRLEDYYPDPRSAPSQKSKNLYGVVFDAGSTGTRVHVFNLSKAKSEFGEQYTLANELFLQVKPGLSAYAKDPSKAADSLTPLLKAAETYLPAGLCSKTAVVLRATAGLRLLKSREADDILQAVASKLSSSCLVKSKNAVSILDGNQEGLYLWISLNFMTGRMPAVGSSDADPKALSRTVGTLDLGGGSTQITFAPSDPMTLVQAPDGYATSIETGQPVNKTNIKQGKQVYSHSYLGLGLMSARYSMLHISTKRLPTQYLMNNVLYSPCTPVNTSIPWTHANRNWEIRNMPSTTSVLLESELKEASQALESESPSPVLVTCYAQALQALRDPVEGDPAADIFQPSGLIVHRPAELTEQQFYAFSYIFDLAMSVGLINDVNGTTVTIGEFRDAAQRICNKPNPDQPFECMDLNFIVALLHNGYGFPWDKKLTLQKKVKSFEISWGLGALFAEMAAAR
ncbi:unnamed protein product [Calicophoron daubneyi]|uniref:Uncharacterized protein n=1 Tax=Calicophoron daubneyi TaxID=300641 RepID=A0AAV2TT75_CALDB